jgi:hypothetical protein
MSSWKCPNCLKSVPVNQAHHCPREESAEPTEKKSESVNHPSHYGGDTTYEVIKVLENWLTPDEYIGFLKGNVIKYNARARKKNGREDYAKAAWYQNELSRYLEKSV